MSYAKPFATRVVVEPHNQLLVVMNHQRNPIIIYNIERREGLRGVEALA